MALNRMTLNLALRIDRSLQQQYADYREECESDRAQGHIPHYCEHGMNRWTDYDNICGPCEDGLTDSDPIQRRTRAIANAKCRVEQYDEITKAMTVLRRYRLDAVDTDLLVKVVSEILFC